MMIMTPGVLLDYFRNYDVSTGAMDARGTSNGRSGHGASQKGLPCPLGPVLIGDPLTPQVAIAWVAIKATRLSLVVAIWPLLNGLAVCCCCPPAESDYEEETDRPWPGPVMSVDFLQYLLNEELLRLAPNLMQSDLTVLCAGQWWL
jgi:hypothetical protein